MRDTFSYICQRRFFILARNFVCGDISNYHYWYASIPELPVYFHHKALEIKVSAHGTFHLVRSFPPQEAELHSQSPVNHRTQYNTIPTVFNARNEKTPEKR